MKTYAPKTKALAAVVILEAAVGAVIGVLRPAVALERMVPDADALVDGVMRRAVQQLTAAGQSAALLLDEDAS